MKEEWRTIKETDGKYSVSNLGNVKRNEHYTIVSPTFTAFYKERKVNPYKTAEGYLVVRLQTGSKSITRKIHRLVAEAFIDNPNGFPCVNHLDEDRSNNIVTNLEWCTVKHNNNYGTRKEKLQKISGIKVAQYDLSGKLIKVWDSITQAAQSFGTKTTSNIGRVCKGKPGRKTYKGYIWKYVDSKVIGDVSLKDQMLTNKSMLVDVVLNTFSDVELKISKSKK